MDSQPEEGNYQTPPKAKATFRRKNRESVLSPSSLRASKLNRIRDDAMFEEVQMMIQAELTLVRQELEREMVKAKEDYRLQLDNELTVKMTNKVRSEVEVAWALWERELEKTMTTVAKWRAEMEERLKEKDALIDGLKRELAEYKDKLEKDKDDQPKVFEELNSIKEQVKILKEEEQ